MFLIFDTETTGLPNNWKAPITDSENWPRMVQISWQIHDKKGELIEVKNYIIKPEGYEIPFGVSKIHGITTERANKQGIDLNIVLNEFNEALSKSEVVVGHNVSFDNNIIGAEFYRKEIETDLLKKKIVDTMPIATKFCALPNKKGTGFKYPKLEELHEKLFGEKFAEAHNAAADVEATARCFLELIRIDVLPLNLISFSQEDLNEFKNKNSSRISPIGLNTQAYTPDDFKEEEISEPKIEEPVKLEIDSEELNKIPFSHLHLHTQFSILDGATEIKSLAKKAKKDGMNAVAITDHGNMFGTKTFYNAVKAEGLKPILGCEVYLAKGRIEEKSKKRYHLILLAKNEIGYKNLMKMVSISFEKGMYYKPRIDKDILETYKEGIIVLSACLGGEVPDMLMNSTFAEAEKAALWYKEMFGDDFYLEFQRHISENPINGTYENQKFVNSKLLEISKKHNIKIVATNDVHYLEKEEFAVQQRLIAIGRGEYMADKKEEFYTGEEFFKTQEEMRKLFADLPEALTSTQEIADKVELYELNKQPIMPDFELPTGFNSEDEYLKHLAYKGAEMRWGELNKEITERLDFELETIKNMGFPGYFLIVQDFLTAARKMGVIVGPGRGSAAGSAVAYCLRITDIDPIKYKLLFERFLNPDRISMPDIDIDFDDDGRSEVLKWVVEKYGKKRVAHIITFGSMAAKSAIRDVARVHQFPLPEADKLAKLVPEKPGTKLADAFKEVKELADIKKEKSEAGDVLNFAIALEGSVRNTGTHACGIIIGKEDLDNYVPISTVKNSELDFVTQYDGNHVEDIGLLKMDFLGLKTLSIIKDAIENIKLSKNVEIDIDKIDLEDTKTYETYSNGETVGLFQFESPGMQKYLKELKPSSFEDLIAMVALYRPGPMDYIPSFIARKHGKEKIAYDLPDMEEELKETYGITVYQEQVMLLSRTLAGFTKGESDTLRKAMGKKKADVMAKLKTKFIDGCKANNHPEKIAGKIWTDWEKFASYAFNKSHATCYAHVSFQTGYLKANYPAEYMAAVLSRNLNDIKKVTFFMDECKRMSLSVLGPDVNESFSNFTVNKKGDIRFGMKAIKGVGGSAVENIIKERKENGAFKNIYDFIERVNLTSVNKRTLENLAYAGAFDSFTDIERYQYFNENNDKISFIEVLSKYGNSFQSQNTSAPSLFGDTLDAQIEKPIIPDGEKWHVLDKLKAEKEVIGIYLSSHPLDPFKLEIENIRATPLAKLSELKNFLNHDIKIVGYITSVIEKINKSNKPYGRVVLEDYSGTYEHLFWAKQWVELNGILKKDYSVLISAKVKENKYREGELQLEIGKVTLLSEVNKEIFKSITLNIEYNKVSKQLVDELLNEIEKTQSKNEKANTSLNIKLYDKEQKMTVDLFSRNFFININKHFIDFLKKNPNIEHKIN